ncbi:hypothetical protein NK8_85880 (plasmid) [Caballeronia sp. NK8]|nr:hypothetical protein NK8_85880 [Caballeronia sp. NK8]
MSLVIGDVVNGISDAFHALHNGRIDDHIARAAFNEELLSNKSYSGGRAGGRNAHDGDGGDVTKLHGVRGAI